MTKLVHGEEITFRKHVLDIKNIAEVIDDLRRIFQRKLALLDKTLGRVHADGDAFSMVASFLREAFDILEITDSVREELPVKIELTRGYISGHDGCGLEFDTLEILCVGWSLALLFAVIVWLLGDDGHVTQCREVRRDNQSRGKRRLESRLIKTRDNPPCITRLPISPHTKGSLLRTGWKTCTPFRRWHRCTYCGKTRPWCYSRCRQRTRRGHSCDCHDGSFRRIRGLRCGSCRRR